MSTFLKILVSILAVGILVCLAFAANGISDPTENVLMSIILTLFSIIATWLASHAYGQANQKAAVQDVKEFHQERLRMYALKAAEKVTTLSNQLQNLSAYLQEELDNDEYETSKDAYFAKCERIGSAIHLINTLKSINDNALSDWEGVIDDVLDEQREEQKEREQELTDLINRVEAIARSQKEQISRLPSGSHVGAGYELESIRNELRFLIASMAGTPVTLRRAKKSARREVTSVCPSCQTELHYAQRPKRNSVKGLQCDACNTRLVSRYNREGDSFIVELRKNIPEEIPCPWCGKENNLEVDSCPGASTSGKCKKCGGIFRVARATDGCRITRKGTRPDQVFELTEEIVDAVHEVLPAQPWPKNIHKEVAEKLGIHVNLAYSAISQLIRQGRR